MEKYVFEVDVLSRGAWLPSKVVVPVDKFCWKAHLQP